MLDDLFMFHETLVERYIGMDEDGLYACLAIATLAFLIRFRAFICYQMIVDPGRFTMPDHPNPLF